MTAPPRIVPDDDAGRAEAIQVLKAGGIVALPTDTVYGLAVDLAAPGGIERLFAAKRRPTDRAVMLLLADAEQAGGLVLWTPSAAALSAAFWPGGLTIVVAQRPDAALPPELTGGRSDRRASASGPRRRRARWRRHSARCPSPPPTCPGCPRRPTPSRSATSSAMRSI